MSLVATLIKRRTFLTRMVLGWLASTSSTKIGAGLALAKSQLASKPQRNGVVFYVAPSGNNAWSGNQSTPNPTKTDGPFATLQRARDAIRELKRQQGDMLKQPVTVFVRAGTYFLDQPLLLQPEDSGTSECPVIFAAYPNENPLISGGKRITNWQKLDGNRWVAQLPEAKAGKWNFRLLRTNNEWAIRARYPKFEPKQPLTGGWLYAKWYGKPWEKGTFNTGVILNNVGDQLEWRLLIPAAGDYKVWVRYSHNLEASRDERATMRVGKSQPVRLNNLPSTGGKYQWTQAATVRLVAGEQALVWENSKDGTFDLDAFCLTDDSDWNPETSISIVSGWGKYELQSPKAGHHLLIVQAEACEKAVGKEVKVSKPDLPGVYDRILIDPETFPRFQNWDGAEVHIFPASGWLNTIVKVNGVDKEHHTLLVDCEQHIRPGNRFFIANVREALDSPGEWYLDQKAGELIYWPTQPDFPHVEVVAPTMDRLVVLQGDAQTGRFVEHIHFRGFSFTDTDYTLFDSIPDSLRSYLREEKEPPAQFRHPNTISNGYFTPADAAMWLIAARQCGVSDCNFLHLGGYAVRLEQRSSQNEMSRNTMAQLGQGGVVLLGSTDTQPFNNLIADNDIHDCGQIYKHVAGVYLTTGSDNRIVHNRIHGLPRYGISLKSYNHGNYSHNNIVEFNEIVNTNQETHDTGAIESYAPERKNSGNIIRFNLIRKAVGMSTNSEGEIMTPYNSAGIFLDSGSSGLTISGNIIVGPDIRVAVVLSNGKDNIFENNIFVNSVQHQIGLLQLDDYMKGNVFRHNIVVFDNPKADLWKSWAREWKRAPLAECDFNLYWHTGGLDLAQTEQVITPEGNFAKWQAAGFDRNSLIADPRFSNLAKGNFQLKPDSPAFQLGFKPIPIKRIATGSSL
ncbi:MAG TPA: right-handed parallel beta-helix repeat-containing protein [Stenomitos sp.]